MKLIDRLDQLKGQKAKIGAASAFVFAGTVSDDMRYTLDSLDTTYKAKLNRTCEEYRDKIKKAPTAIRSRISKAKCEKEAGWVTWSTKEQRNRRMSAEAIETAEKLLAMTEGEILDYIKDYRKKYRQFLTKTERYLEKYTPFADREIKEEYESIEEIGDGTILLVDGIEQGDKWFIGDTGNE